MPNIIFINLFKSLALIFTVALLTSCSQDKEMEITQWPVDNNCSLHEQSCSAVSGDAEVTLKISPHPIPIARPLGIEVETKNLQIKKMELDISGINMYMGYNRVELQSANPNRFVGTSMLAFCTNETMLWQVTLMIHLADGSQIQIPYELETSNR